jgi:outer membrane immunogenic protein
MHFCRSIAGSIGGKNTGIKPRKATTRRNLVGVMLRFVAMSLAVATSAMVFNASAIADGYSLKDTAYPYVAPSHWTGFYIGGNIGAAWSDSNVGNTVCTNDPTCYFGGTFPLNLAPYGSNVNAAGSGHLSDEAFIGGGQIGYNWQTGLLVFGVEGDFDAMNTHAARTVDPLIGPSFPGYGLNLSDTVSSNYLATIRGRLGYAWGGNLLTYFTGGVAFTDFKHSHAASEFSTGPGGEIVVGPCSLGGL